MKRSYYLALFGAIMMLVVAAFLLPVQENDWPIQWEVYDDAHLELNGVELHTSGIAEDADTITVEIVNNSEIEIKYFYETIKLQKREGDVWLYQVDTRVSDLPTPMVPYMELRSGDSEQFELNISDVIPSYYRRDAGEYRLYVPLHVRESDSKWSMAYVSCPLIL